MEEELEEKKQKKTTTKKVATGTTKKAVQKRSSSIAGKQQNSKVAGTKKKNETRKNAKESNAQEKQVVTKQTKNKKQGQETQKEKEPKQKVAKKENKEETALVQENHKLKEIQKAVAQEIKSNKKITQEEKNKIYGRIFEELCFTVGVMLYLFFLILGFVHIEKNVFITDLKVFGISVLVIAIGFFEYAFRKDSGRYALHGIEILVLALSTIGFIYTVIMLEPKTVAMMGVCSYVFGIYYLFKCMVQYKKMKKRYEIDALKKIIQK